MQQPQPKLKDSENTLYSPIQFLNPPRWFLLPHNQTTPDVARAFEFIPYGYRHVFDMWASAGTTPFRTNKFRGPKGLKPIPFFTKVFSDAMLDAILKNQRVRWAFKRLIQRWRTARLLQVNTEDVVTMEVPKVPIYIYDWTNRSRYVFEASTLFRGIRDRILFAQNLFASPQQPRNPFTNQDLTYGQLHFALEALRGASKSDWATEALRACDYDLAVFKRRNNTQLRVTALKVLFANPKDEDYRDILFDFIDFCHDDAECEMERKDVWEWCIEHRHENARIQTWRRYCYAYYHGLITQPAEEFNKTKDKILEQVAPLLMSPMTDLILMWNSRLKSVKTK